MALVKRNNETTLQVLSLSLSEGSLRSIVELWDVDTGARVKSFEIPQGRHVRSLVVLNNGDDGEAYSFLCSMRNPTGNIMTDGMMRFNIDNGECIGIFDTGDHEIMWVDRVDDTKIATLERGLVEAAFGGAFVCVWNIETRRRIIMSISRNIQFVTILGSDKFLLQLDDLKSCALWNIESNSIEKEWSSDVTIHNIHLVDNESFLCKKLNHVLGLMETTLALMKIDTGEEIWNVTLPTLMSARILPISGRRLICGSSGADIHMYKMQSDTCTKVFNGHCKPAVHFLPPSNDDASCLFLTGSMDGSIKLWDYSHWFEVKHLILLRELFSRGRATRSRRSKRSRKQLGAAASVHSDTVLQDFICNVPDEIFQHVVSLLD